jgi:predicted transposase/invertase (TIGR01784 family)
MAMASRILVTITREEKEWARESSEFKYEVDTQSRIINAERRGEQKGMQKGRKAEIVAIARSLKAAEIPVSTITSTTGLSFEEIAKL